MAEDSAQVERWLLVVEHEGYEISDLGRLRKRGKLASTTDVVNGYTFYRIQVNGVRRRHAASDLVLAAFVGPRPSGLVARHLNDVRSDNRLANLTWGTPSQNSYDAVRNGRNHCANQTCCKWNHPLLAFNLVEWWLPHRKCLACARARAYISRCGGDMQTISDHYFSQLVPVADAA